jgi:hypothetical protein
VPFTFSGGKVDAGITFNLITCQVSPAGPTCTVSPSSLTLDENGNGTVQVTITTFGPATTASRTLPQRGGQEASQVAYLIALPGLLVMLLGMGVRAGESFRGARLVSLLLIGWVAVLGAGCGSGVQRTNIPCASCTTAGTYTVTVTATSQRPPLQANGIFTLVVQQ